MNTTGNPWLDAYLCLVGQAIGYTLRIRVRRNRQVPVEVDRRIRNG